MTIAPNANQQKSNKMKHESQEENQYEVLHFSAARTRAEAEDEQTQLTANCAH